MDCLIRPITLEDTHFLWEMLYEAIYVAEGVKPPAGDVLLQPDIRRYLQDWGQPHDSGFVALDPVTSNRIGAVWLRLLIGDQKGYGYVDEATPELTIAVVPECRGKGIGTRLKLAGIDLALSHGGKELHTFNDELNGPMRAINAKLGFQPETGWWMYRKNP